MSSRSFPDEKPPHPHAARAAREQIARDRVMRHIVRIGCAPTRYRGCALLRASSRAADIDIEVVADARSAAAGAARPDIDVASLGDTRQARRAHSSCFATNWS